MDDLEDDRYAHQFRRFVVRSIELILEALPHASPDSYPRALHSLRFGLQLVEERANEWPVVRDVLLALAPRLEQAGYREEWISFLERGIELSSHLTDPEAEGWLRLFLGELYQYLAQDAHAQRQYEQSLRLFQQRHRTSLQGQALYRLANVALRQRQLADAKQWAKAALAHLPDDAQDIRARVHLVLGDAATDERALDSARLHYEEALALSRTANVPRITGWCQIHLGILAAQQQQVEQAIYHFTQAIGLLEPLNDPLHLAIAYVNLGNIHYLHREAAEALDYYHRAAETFKKLEATRNLAQVYTNCGLVYQKLKRWPEAQESLTLALEQWKLIGNRVSMVNTMEAMVAIHRETGATDKASALIQEAFQQHLPPLQDDPAYESLRDKFLAHWHNLQTDHGGPSTSPTM